MLYAFSLNDSGIGFLPGIVFGEGSLSRGSFGGFLCPDDLFVSDFKKNIDKYTYRKILAVTKYGSTHNESSD